MPLEGGKRIIFQQGGHAMADTEEGKSSGDNELQMAEDRGLLKYLGGTEYFLDNQKHTGVAIRVTSAGGKESSLVISDVDKKVSHEAPVFTTQAVRLELSRLEEFLAEHEIPLPEPLKNVLKGTALSCDAFYYTGENGPLLMLFTLDFDAGKANGGLIKELSGSEALGKLFDVTGVSVRIIRCSKEDFKRLKDYCSTLSG
jgi:hypothetical protein